MHMLLLWWLLHGSLSLCQWRLRCCSQGCGNIVSSGSAAVLQCRVRGCPTCRLSGTNITRCRRSQQQNLVWPAMRHVLQSTKVLPPLIYQALCHSSQDRHLHAPQVQAYMLSMGNSFTSLRCSPAEPRAARRR